MRYANLRCPNCGANIGKEVHFCSHCGTPVKLDDESETFNTNYTYRKVDEARLKESEAKERIRSQELNIEKRQKDREYRIKILVGAFTVLGVLFYIGIMYWGLKSLEPKANEVRISSSADDYRGDNYDLIVSDLKAAGFTNIETVVLDDLATGLFGGWFTKDGSIERISINGDASFDKGDIYPKDATIIISYHTFPSD